MERSAVEVIKSKTINAIINDLPVLVFGTSPAEDIEQVRADRWYLNEAFRLPGLVGIENHWLFFQSMAVMYQLEGQFEEALQAGAFYAELVEHYFGAEDELYIYCQQLFGEIHFEQGNYPKAEEAFEGALQLLHRLNTASPLEDAEFLLATFEWKVALLYLKQGRYQEAEGLFTVQLEQIKATGENPYSELANLAIVYREQGRHLEAEAAALESFSHLDGLASDGLRHLRQYRLYCPRNSRCAGPGRAWG